jgi:hypothetical protein
VTSLYLERAGGCCSWGPRRENYEEKVYEALKSQERVGGNCPYARAGEKKDRRKEEETV